MQPVCWGIVKICVLWKVGNKFCEIWVAHNISKIFRSPLVWDISWHPLLSKGQTISSHISFYEGGPAGLFRLQRQMIQLLDLHYLQYIEWHENLSALSGRKSSEVFCSTPGFSSRGPAVWPMWLRIWYMLWENMPSGVMAGPNNRRTTMHILRIWGQDFAIGSEESCFTWKIVPTMIKIENLAVGHLVIMSHTCPS